MKKRLFSILLALCMALCLVPTTAFAESETEETPVCTCETACTAEAMNADCPICGVEGALPENCAKCAQPADGAAVQPEGEVSDPQPEAALTALIGGSETAKDVSTAEELTAAIADVNFDTVRLAGDISISSTLTVNRAVTLDLNGYVLKYESANKGSVIVVKDGVNLTLTDSNTTAVHKFTPDTNGLWVLDETSGTETVNGGVITGGTGYPIWLYSEYLYYGGGVYIAPGGQLTMTGGNIIGCSAEFGGGICIESERDGKQGQFSMSGGNIIGCSAECGGGVYVDSESNQSPFSMSGGSIIGCVASDIGGGVRASGTFKMSGQAVIRSCTVESATQSIYGGGIYVNSSSSFEMSGEAKIEYCQAISNSSKSSNGGGVYLTNNTKFTLSGNAVIQNCKADNSVTPGETYGGGVSADCMRQITLEGNAQIFQCTAANGSGLYITGSLLYPNDWGKLYANGGSVNGDVVLGDKDKSDGPCTITGTGETVFKGKVTVTPDSTIEKGTFNGEVINNGTITGGTFNGEVINNGTITGGTFNTPMTGSGTKNDPYQIGTAEQLKRFRDIVNGAGGQTQNRGAYAVLTANIDLNNEPWTPIGNYTTTNEVFYEGTFDGGGHTISNLNVTDRFICDGLFGAIKGGTIKNLTVAGNVSHNYFVGQNGHVGGIVGCASNAAIENCSNHCSVTGGSSDFIGGIAGSNIDGARIIDCYNVGTITGTINGTGGVTGLNMGTISNCYNVGTVSNGDQVGEIVGSNHGTVENCYYLAGTNLNAVGQNNSNGNITKTESKTAANFANDTVLALLKADRGNSPWDSCQYVAMAKITLPVFKGQGDAHDHQSNDWESNETEHWQVCTCGAVFHKAEHSGGTATCTQRATCTVCGAEYGDALGHDFTTSWTHDDNEHWKQCSRCDKKDDVSPHTWDNGTITTAPTCTKAGEKTYSCTKCDATKIEPIPATGHRWKSEWTSDATHHWHECANESCDVTDNAGKNGYAEHSGGKATCKDKAICEICGDSYGSLDPNNHTDLKHIDAKAATAAEEGNIAYWYCDGCKKYFSDAAAKTEIAKADTVTAKRSPQITAGDGAAVTQGEKKELTFTSDASFADFLRVELDGTALDEKNYTKREGSTIITLNRDFVATLSVGEHTLAIVSQHGTATAKFTVKAKPTETATPQPTVTPQPTAQPTPTVQPVSPIPGTGDTANPALWFALLIVSGGAAIGITVVSRKKKHKENMLR